MCVTKKISLISPSPSLLRGLYRDRSHSSFMRLKVLKPHPQLSTEHYAACKCKSWSKPISKKDGGNVPLLKMPLQVCSWLFESKSHCVELCLLTSHWGLEGVERVFRIEVVLYILNYPLSPPLVIVFPARRSTKGARKAEPTWLRS